MNPSFPPLSLCKLRTEPCGTQRFWGHKEEKEPYQKKKKKIEEELLVKWGEPRGSGTPGTSEESASSDQL